MKVLAPTLVDLYENPKDLLCLALAHLFIRGRQALRWQTWDSCTRCFGGCGCPPYSPWHCLSLSWWLRGMVWKAYENLLLLPGLLNGSTCFHTHQLPATLHHPPSMRSPRGIAILLCEANRNEEQRLLPSAQTRLARQPQGREDLLKCLQR